MVTHTFLANGDTECTIIARPGICCSQNPNGTILIETGNESITIHLRTTSHGGVPLKIGDERNNQTSANLYSDGGSLEHVAQADEDVENLTGYDTYETEEHTEANQEKDREDAVNGTNEIDQFCEELATKILKKWEKRPAKWTKGAAELLAGPNTFFGGFNSFLQWSFQTLNRSETKVDRFLLPFHKINLFVWWSSSSIQRKNAVCDTKNALFETVKSGYSALSPTEKKTIQKQVKRYVAQGEVLWLMYNHAQGLLITVPQFITTKELTFLGRHKAQLCVSELRWMPEELLKASELYLNIVCTFTKAYFPSLPKVPSRNQPQSSDQLDLGSDTDLGTETSPGDVFTGDKMIGSGQARYAQKRQRLDDRSGSHTPPHQESTNHHSPSSILPASVVVDITCPIVGTTDAHTTTHSSARNRDLISANSTRKRQKTRDGGAFCKFLTLKVPNITNAVIKVNPPQRDDSAGLDDVFNRPQPEHHNITERPYTFPNEQARDSASVGAALMITSSVDADNHDSPAPQPSGQDGPEHEHAPILPYSTPSEAIDTPATGFIGGSGEGSTLARSTRQNLQPFEGITSNNASTAAILTTTDTDRSSIVDDYMSFVNWDFIPEN